MHNAEAPVATEWKARTLVQQTETRKTWTLGKQNEVWAILCHPEQDYWKMETVIEIPEPINQK